MLKKTFFKIVCFLLFFTITSTVLASSDYNFNISLNKRVGYVGKVKEKIGLFLKFSSTSKAKYWRKLIDTRLAEIIYVVDVDMIGDVEETTSRYSTYLGHYTNYLEKKNLTSQREISLAMFEKHKEILGILRDNFEYDSAWWLLIQHDINTIDIFKGKVESL